MPFRFKLEPLLRVRRREEESAQRVVAGLERERQTLEGALRRRQEALSRAKQDLRGRLTGTLNARDLRGYAGAALQQMRDAQRLVVELAGVHRRLEAARADLAEAAARRRALELIRERRFAAWKAALDKAEQVALDDLAGAARARREAP